VPETAGQFVLEIGVEGQAATAATTFTVDGTSSSGAGGPDVTVTAQDVADFVNGNETLRNQGLSAQVVNGQLELQTENGENVTLNQTITAGNTTARKHYGWFGRKRDNHRQY